MITIEEVEDFITGFKLNSDEVYHYINKDIEDIGSVAFKVNQFTTAMKFYKYMVLNHVDKIENSYYINTHNIDKDFIMTDYADIIKDMPNPFKNNRLSFTVLDKKSPLYMTKVNIKMRLLCSSELVKATFSIMNNFFFSFYMDKTIKDGKFGSFDTAIRRFLKDTINSAEAVNLLFNKINRF